MLVSGRNDSDVDQLGLAYSRAVNLATVLVFQRKFVEADDVDQRADQLADQRRAVMAKRMAGWTGRAQAIHIRIKSSNTQLQRQITAIKRRRDNAQNIVNAIGYLDDIVKAVSTII